MTPHLGDRLSALLDGELSADEARAAREHLDGCAACRAELDATARTRSLVRSLPEVDPPFGFYERLLRPRSRSRWRRAAGIAAGGIAAALLLAAMATPPSPRVRPAVADLVERHAATASAGGDPVTQFVPVAVTVDDRR